MAPIDNEFASLHGSSFGWALACCGRRRDDAEDVLQDVYAKVLSGRAVFRQQSSFKTWLFGVIGALRDAERCAPAATKDAGRE